MKSCRLRFALFAALTLALQGPASVRAGEAQTVAPPPENPSEHVYRLAIVNSYGHSILMNYYSKSIAVLAKSIAPMKVEVTEYDPDGFLKAAHEGRFDMSIASSGLTSLMIEKTGGIPLMAIVTPEMPDPNRANGTAIIVRADRKDLRDIKDLKGKRLAIMSRNAFAGWQIPASELVREGINPNTYFGSIRAVGGPMTKIVRMVEVGDTDIGFVANCLLEKMASTGEIRLSDFHVIHDQSAPDAACRHSTELYPGWFFSVKPTVSTATAREITAAFLTTPSEGYQWTIPTDHRRLYDVFQLMQVPVGTRHDIHWLLQEYRAVIAWVLLIVVIILGNTVLLARLARRRAQQLEVTMQQKMQAELAARHNAMQVETLTRASAIGLLSSMVAHELKQPLTVITNYAGSLKRRLRRGDVAKETLLTSLDEIEESGNRAAAIINRVRDYGRIRNREFTTVNLSEVIPAVIEHWRRHASHPVACSTSLIPDVFVEADRLEIELVVLNLVKNAAAAAAPLSDALIEISLERLDGYARIRVRDNGPELSDDIVARIGQVGFSTKENGLGLGLSIVRSLLEAHGGSLTIERRTDLGGRGLICTVRLPISETSKNSSNVKDLEKAPEYS